MMCFSRGLAACAVALVSVTLHGCGGGGDATTTTTTSTAPTTTVSTTTTPACPKQDPVAEALNTIYMGYVDGTTTESVGVTVRFIQEPHAIDGMWYYCGQGCYQGYCDCRVSASLLNHKMMINVSDKGSFPTGTLGADIGVVFEQTMVEKTIGKCYYPYDGGTDMRYNRGCGCGMPNNAQHCDNNQCAYKSLENNGKPMTANSPSIRDCNCDGGARANNPTKHTDAQCYWTGSAFTYDGPGNPPGPNENATTPNAIAKMVSHRLHDQSVQEKPNGIETTFWNEVVIDGVAMQDEMKKDPTKVISHIVWLKQGTAGDGRAHKTARAMSQWFVDKGGFKTGPPVVAIDTSVDVTKCGPFTVATPSVKTAIAV